MKYLAEFIFRRYEYNKCIDTFLNIVVRKCPTSQANNNEYIVLTYIIYYNNLSFILIIFFLFFNTYNFKSKGK